MDVIPLPLGVPGEPDASFFADILNAQPTPEPEVDSDEFAEEVKEDVIGLLYLGKLSKSFEVYGHRFILKTLTVEEELAVGQIIDEYGGSIFQGKASTAAFVAASVSTVDGEEVVRALMNDPVSRVRAKFNYVTQWDPVIVEALYGCVRELTERKLAAFAEVSGK
jgi:hypothetical protein